MPVPINTNFVQLQPQPDYWTRLLANLLQMGQLGFGVWQGLQNQQTADTNRMQATNQMMQGASQWGQGTEHIYQALVAGGMDPKQARAIADQDRAARGKERWAADIEERDLQRRKGNPWFDAAGPQLRPEGSVNPFQPYDPMQQGRR